MASVHSFPPARLMSFFCNHRCLCSCFEVVLRSFSPGCVLDEDAESPTPQGETDRYVCACTHTVYSHLFFTLHDVRQPILFASQVLFQSYAFLSGVKSFPGVLDVQDQVIPFIFGVHTSCSIYHTQMSLRAFGTLNLMQLSFA